MTKLLKLIELPHVMTHKSKWLRRIMITIMIPQELVRAVYGVFASAAMWWQWDGTLDPSGFPVFKQ
jgi:hypothetical protein